MKKCWLFLVLLFGLAQAQDTSWLFGDWQIGGKENYSEENNFIFSFKENNEFVLWVTSDGETFSETGTWQLEGNELFISTESLETHTYKVKRDKETVFLSGGYFATNQDVFGTEPMPLGKVPGLQISSQPAALADTTWLLGEWQYQDESLGLLLSFRQGGRLMIMMLENFDVSSLEAGSWTIQDEGLTIVSDILGNKTFGFSYLDAETPLLILTGDFGETLDSLAFERTFGQVVQLRPAGEASTDRDTVLNAELLDSVWLVGKWQQVGDSPYVLTINPDNSYQFQIDDEAVPVGERGLWSLVGGQFRFMTDSDEMLVFALSKSSPTSFTLGKTDGQSGGEVVFERVP